MNNEKILLLGGAGYIGSALYPSLKKEYLLDSVDLEWFGTQIPNTKLDFNELSKDHVSNYDVVILLAGHSSVRMCEGDINSSFNNNVRNFINLLPKIQPHQKFIYASSSSIYSSLSSDIKEESCKEYSATNYYDFSKYAIDSYMKIYGELNPIEFYSLRFGTLGGYSYNLRNDIMINSMINNFKNTGEININNIGISRPILGISDLCRGIESIIKFGDFNKRGFYNMASFNSTVYEIGSKVSEILKCKLNISKIPSKCYDFQINSKKFTNNFGFIFSETIESIVESLINNKVILESNRNNSIKYE